MDFLRPFNHDPRYLGLTPAQWWCFAFFALGIYVVVMRMRSGDEPVWKSEGEEDSPTDEVAPS
jgi:hypothetical protein